MKSFTIFQRYSVRRRAVVCGRVYLASGAWILGCNIEETEASTDEVSGVVADTPSSDDGAWANGLLNSRTFGSETSPKSKTSK